jgi:hypothetical protein
MAESTLGYDDPDSPDKYLHSWSRSIGGTTKEDQTVIEGEPYLAAYIAQASTISTGTSADHLIALQADGTNYTRIKRIYVSQVVAAGSATLAQLQVIRTTTAGTGGTAVTARPLDAGDAAYGGDIRTLPTAKGTEGVTLLVQRLYLTNSVTVPNTWTWEPAAGEKPIIIGTASTDGICLKIVTGIASGTVDIRVEFVVSSYL